MENIINRIVDIENKAKDIVAQAEAASEGLPEQIELELGRYRDKLEEKLGVAADAKIAQINDTLKKNCDKVSTETSQASELLLAAHAKHGEEWAQRLAESVKGDV